MENLLSLLLVSVVSSYLTYYFTAKSKKTEAALRFKEERYLNLLILLQGFVGSTISGETKRKFFEEQYKSWLYSSDGVVRAVNEMIQLLIDQRGSAPDGTKGKKIIGNIVLEMRKDLLGRTGLNDTDFSYTDVVD